MKATRFFLNTAAVLAGAICLCTCSDDSQTTPEPDPTPGVDPDNGEVTFVITNENGNGTGSTDSSAEVAYGDTLSMVISQKSSYTDSDGKVFTCEPEATISLYAAMDTVYAQNENLLTQIQEDSQVQTSENGTNPVRHLLDQTFKVGNQSIHFDLGYEVYTYINNADQAIEMPYVKLNQANYGSAAADEKGETAPETKASAKISDRVVTLTPLASTRAIVNDTVLYNVNVRFNLKAESQNAKDDVSRTIEFSVNYIGAVVSSMEVPDPENSALSYDVSVVKGTGNGTAESPAIAPAGDSLRVQINQTSSYSDTDGTKVERNPYASIALFASRDIVYAASIDELTSLQDSSEPKTSTSGSEPIRHLIEQTFNVGGKEIALNSAYEVYTYTNKAEKLIEMPYVKISPAGTPEITIAESPRTKAVVNDTTFYTVTVRFNLELESVNAAETSSRTIAFAVTYPGAVITETEVDEPELVSVEYRTGYVWEEAHDNLPLLYYATVYRDRHYSNGEVLTDRFVDAGHMVSKIPSTNFSRPSIQEYEALGLQYILNEFSDTVINDSVTICNMSTVVPDISALTTEVFRDEYMTDPAGTWSAYNVSKLYDVNEFIATDNVPSNGNWQTSTLETGWYFKDIRYRKSLRLRDSKHNNYYIDAYILDLVVYDQFLVIDGRLIDFLEYQPQYNFNLKSENTSAGLVHTFECRFEFMGRNFYGALINTITQQ